MPVITARATTTIVIAQNIKCFTNFAIFSPPLLVRTLIIPPHPPLAKISILCYNKGIAPFTHDQRREIMLLIIALVVIALLLIGFVANLGCVIIVNALNQAYRDHHATRYLS